jgi:hypothetical protein
MTTIDLPIPKQLAAPLSVSGLVGRPFSRPITKAFVICFAHLVLGPGAKEAVKKRIDRVALARFRSVAALGAILITPSIFAFDAHGLVSSFTSDDVGIRGMYSPNRDKINGAATPTVNAPKGTVTWEALPRAMANTPPTSIRQISPTHGRVNLKVRRGTFAEGFNRRRGFQQTNATRADMILMELPAGT